MTAYAIDRDYTPKPGCRIVESTLFHTGSQASAVKRALADLDANACEGQSLIGVSDLDALTGQTVGYAIKPEGAPAYFEEHPDFRND